MQVIEPPHPAIYSDKQTLFLAGSIDNGKAINWQAQAIKALSGLDIVIFNPRRSDWDARWEQSIQNPDFKEQVTWELDMLDKADLILMHLTGESKSPISLLEMGLYAKSKKLIVSCEQDFWRRGNVEVVCQRFDAPLYASLEEGIAQVEHLLGGK